MERPALSGGAVAFAAEAGAYHALIDCACGAVVYAEVAAARMPLEVLVLYVMLYNLLAFALQPCLGWFSDLRGVYRAVSAAGPWLVALAVVSGVAFPWTGAVLAGLGNACFHVGVAGALLPRSGGRALEPGIFVGPGAIGIFAGVWMGANLYDWRITMVPLLLGSGVRLWLLVPARTSGPATAERGHVAFLVAVVAALFCSAAIRGAVAGVLTGGWRSSVTAGLMLAAAACCGKCLGGWAADRYGWQRTATLALVLSAPLIFAGTRSLSAAICGMLLFQFSMSVTLAGAYAVMPRRPALAFGLPSLALGLASLPDFTPFPRAHAALVRSLLIPVILVSAAMLWWALAQLNRVRPPSGIRHRSAVYSGS